MLLYTCGDSVFWFLRKEDDDDENDSNDSDLLTLGSLYEQIKRTHKSSCHMTCALTAAVTNLESVRDRGISVMAGWVPQAEWSGRQDSYDVDVDQGALILAGVRCTDCQHWKGLLLHPDSERLKGYFGSCYYPISAGGQIASFADQQHKLTPRFTPAPIMWFWTTSMNKRECVYLHIVKEKDKN